MIWFKLFEIQVKLINYVMMLAIILLVVQDLPLRSYLIDPAANLIKQYPSFIATLFVIGVISLCIREILQLYFLLKEKQMIG